MILAVSAGSLAMVGLANTLGITIRYYDRRYCNDFEVHYARLAHRIAGAG